MKLFNSVGPNPRVVRVFMSELGLTMDQDTVDIMAGENRQQAYQAVNPGAQLPALMLDDGTVVSEITAICEYLAEHAGGSHLIGDTMQERVETRMWVRRIDLGIVEPLANGFRSSEGAPMFKDRMRIIPHAADDLKALAQDKIQWLDGLIGDQTYICGDRFSLADIMLCVFLEFGASVGQPIDQNNANIVAWFNRVKDRPSFAA
ncbi:MAG: glutathione S-transferase family protein [Pseudomonadales bacterium]|jgi:glutathione S-transferase|nr:glutathione S-transferase family protein [Pseudomonadales bacterium]